MKYIEYDIPAGFYREEDLPPPPSDDPHYCEWPHPERSESVPSWMKRSLVAGILLFGLLIAAAQVAVFFAV